jgi:hypothetical protein
LIGTEKGSSPLLVAASPILERGAENVAQGRARVGRAVLGDGFLLLGDFQRLDRDLHLAGLLVELDHPRIDLLADRETLGALVVAIASEFGISYKIVIALRNLTPSISTRSTDSIAISTTKPIETRDQAENGALLLPQSNSR